MLQSILFIIVSVWILLSLLLYIYQPKFIYYPYANIEATPQTIGLEYENVTLTTSDDLKINGWWIPHEHARATLLFLHGNAGNISHRLESIKIFHKLGLSVFIIDYRGYGKSEGKPTEKGTYIDAETAWDYLITEKNIKRDNIIIFGRSLGGAVANWLAYKHLPAAVIFESTFTSIADMGKHYYPYLPTSFLTRIKYPSINRIAAIKSPKLIIHSKNDDIVPYKYGKQLFKAANKPKIFLDIHGGHNEGYLISGETYTQGIDKFITDVLKK